MERRREGIFLRSTGKKVSDPNDTRLSLLFDAYTNLGMYLGTNLSLPAKGIAGVRELSFGLGLTRDIYLESGVYTPYSAADGASSWNQGRFFSTSIPLRYRFLYTGSLTGEKGNFSWSLPLYSDPYVNRDFLNRSEDMDLFNIMKQGFTTGSDLTSNLLGSYEWRINYSVSPQLPSLRPYVSSFSISNLSSFMSFRTRDNPGSKYPLSYYNYLPDRSFFYPDKFTIFTLSASVAGQPLSTAPGPRQAAASADPDDGAAQWGQPRSPWPPADPDDQESSGSPAGEDPGDLSARLVPPALTQNFAISGGLAGPRLTLDYRLSPSASSEMQFRSSPANWEEANDVAWDEISSILTTARSSGSLTLTAGESSGLYTNSASLSGTGAWQGYTYMNEDAEEFDTPAETDAAKLRNYNATYFTSSAEFASSLRPFYASEIWGATSLNYTFKNLVAKTVFDGSALDPSWRIAWGAWSRNTIDVHRLSASVNANIMDYRQNLTLSAELPPRQSSMTGSGTFNIWRSTTTVSGRVDDPFETPDWKPVTLTETVKMSDRSNMRYSMVYEPEEEEVTSLSAGLTYKNLEASFSAAKFVPYYLDSSPTNGGWKLTSEPAALHPRDFRVQYRHNLANNSLFDRRLGCSLDLNTSAILDLQRYTYSAFVFSLTATLKITGFMDIAFTTRSENNQIIRYMQGIPYFRLPELNTENLENNPFIDLLNSFRFDNPALRRSSGYKLRDFSLVLTHYLGDWNAKLGIRLAPYLDQTVFPYTYKFNTEVSFLIQWIPVSEFKTEVKSDKGVFDIL
jgi:hypothetical protein